MSDLRPDIADLKRRLKRFRLTRMARRGLAGALVIGLVVVGIALPLALLNPLSKGGAEPGADPTESVTTSPANPGLVTFLDAQDGLSIQAPSGWHFDKDPVPNLLDPVVDLAVGSWAFPVAEDCGPNEALASIPADGALVWIIEYRPSQIGDEVGGMFDMDLQDASFSQESVQPECASAAPSFVLYFRKGSRLFEVHAAYGSATGPVERETALGIVRSLTVEDPA